MALIKSSIYVVLFFVCLPCLTLPNKDNSKVRIFIRDDVYNDYIDFLGDRKVTDIKDFTGKYIRRDVVDMILVQQALTLGGFNKEFVYETGNVNFRNTKLLEQGKLLLSFDSYWHKDALHIKDKVYISQPVIRNGEYYAGIFHARDNVKVSNLSGFKDLQGLTAVSTPRWRTDWQTLNSLPLKAIEKEHSWVAQARMVSKKWVDFMMMPLMPSTNNVYKLDNLELVANKNWVILLDGSRHFVVSRYHPDGERAFSALEKGLQMLRAQGAIKIAYKQAGFIPTLESYKVINFM